MHLNSINIRKQNLATIATGITSSKPKTKKMKAFPRASTAICKLGQKPFIFFIKSSIMCLVGSCIRFWELRSKKFRRPYYFYNLIELMHVFPTGIYLFNVINWNTRMCEICSKLTAQTQERRQWRRSSVFIVNCEQILQFALVFPLLTLKK